MQDLLLGSWGPQIAAFTKQNPLQVLAVVLTASGSLLRLLALGLLGRRGRGLLGAGEAALQRIHLIDDVAAGFRRRLRGDLDAAALLVDQLDQRGLIAVVEFFRREVGRFLFDD